jgi:molybdenum cofactor biosynthesis enzyme MoaA
MAQKLYINLGYACNCSCIMCVLPEYGNFFFDTEEVRETIEESNLVEGDCIEFAGGEPTLHHDFIELCRSTVESTPAQLWILSNGIRFGDRSFSEAFAGVGATGVMIPLYSHRPEVHDAITMRKGSFEKTVRGMQYLQDLGVNMVIKFISMTPNYQDPPEYTQYLIETFPDQRVLFTGLCLMGDAKKRIHDVCTPYGQVRTYLEKALDIAEGAEFESCLHLMPMCVFEAKYWDYFGVECCKDERLAAYLRLLKEKPEGTPLGQPPVCHTCDLKSRCHWIWEAYEKAFGLDEIRPQKIA